MRDRHGGIGSSWDVVGIVSYVGDIRSSVRQLWMVMVVATPAAAAVSARWCWLLRLQM